MDETQKEFKLNFENKLEIDVIGNTSLDKIDEANFAQLSAGISTITPAAADTNDQTAYYDGGGFTDPLVTGKNVTFAISGHRVFGDKAQDYVASKFLDVGMKLRTLARWTNPQGDMVQAVATLTSIVPFGGAANAKQTFSFTLALNGKPEFVAAEGTSDPKSDSTAGNGSAEHQEEETQSATPAVDKTQSNDEGSDKAY